MKYLDRQLSEILARFVARDWNCQQVAPQLYKLNPPGLYGYKQYLLTFNPWQQNWQLIPTKQPNDPHYHIARQILSDRSQRLLFHPFNLQAITMFPVKVTPDKWINLASIQEVQMEKDGGIFVIWVSGEGIHFRGDAARVILKAFEDARKIAFSNLNE